MPRKKDNADHAEHIFYIDDSRMEKSVIAELRALRIKRGISQAELSATLGRYPGFLSKIERNVASPQFRTLCMIASALGAEIRLMPKKKE